MVKQVPFINREDELALIDELIGEWGTQRVLCIDAPGGIGKTRLIQEVRQRYAKESGRQSRLIVTDIIDFDDTIVHFAHNLASRIGQMLDEKMFEPYMRKLQDRRKMETAGVSVERLTQENQVVNQTFIECFNALSDQQRVVLFMDTLDALEGKEVWDFLLKIGASLHNCLLILAGRNADRKAGESIQREPGNAAVEVIELPQLSDQASESYLQQKQQLLHVSLEPELAQKLLFLASGRPILLDLAVEWRAREIPLNWLVEMNLEELHSLSDDERQNRQREFERKLVHHIADTRQLMDWLILLMSRIYPLHGEMIARLLAISEETAKRLLEDVQSYVFVKLLPDGRISLHDEMRRMVNEYVWPEVDPDGDRQRRDSGLAAELLEQEIQTLSERVKELEGEEKTARGKANVQAQLAAFMTIEPLERKIWDLKSQRLAHILFVDLDKGVNTFTEMFDEATRAYRFYLRGPLLDQMKPYIDRLSPEQLYELDNRLVKYLLGCGKYLQAKKLAAKILTRGNISPEQQIEMLIELGNAEIRLGHLKKGLADFERAVEISREYNLPNYLVRALNGRGWAYRNQEDFDQAFADYLEAYQLSLQLNDRKRTASILNNMGYITALRGDQRAALENCQAALNLWEEIGFDRGIGTTYSNLGFIYRLFDQLTEAMNHYNKALDIFMSENDVEWVSNVRCGRAYIFLLQRALDQAEEDLNWALVNGPINLKPRVLYYQGRLFWLKNDLKNARRQYEKCRKISQRIGNKQFNYSSFDRLIELAWEFGEYHRWPEFNAEQKKLFAKAAGKVKLGFRGSALRHIGDLAICHGDYEPALNAYKEGLLLIAKHEVYKPYTVGEQIKQSDKRLCKSVRGDLLSHLGRDLGQFWREERELVERYPEILLTFQRWEQEGGNL